MLRCFTIKPSFAEQSKKKRKKERRSPTEISKKEKRKTYNYRKELATKRACTGGPFLENKAMHGSAFIIQT